MIPTLGSPSSPIPQARAFHMACIRIAIHNGNAQAAAEYIRTLPMRCRTAHSITATRVVLRGLNRRRESLERL